MQVQQPEFKPALLPQGQGLSVLALLTFWPGMFFLAAAVLCTDSVGSTCQVPGSLFLLSVIQESDTAKDL